MLYSRFHEIEDAVPPKIGNVNFTNLILRDIHEPPFANELNKNVRIQSYSNMYLN